MTNTCGTRGRPRLVPAAIFMMLAAAITLPAQTAAMQTFTALFSFDQADGGLPEAALVQATDGNLYGTTTYFGACRRGDSRIARPSGATAGTVQVVTPSGTLTSNVQFRVL